MATDNKLDLAKAVVALNSAGGGGGGGTTPPTAKPVTNKLRSDWNLYVNYLEKKGMKGHPDLDKNNLGNTMLAEYIKKNPSTSLTLDSVLPIQKEFSNYRKWSLDQIKQGKGAFALGANEDNYLRDLSITDSIPGQRTTSYRFPSEYLKTFETNKPVVVEDKGFSTVK